MMHYVYLVIGILTEICGSTLLKFTDGFEKISGCSLSASLRHCLLYGGAVYEGTAVKYRLRYLVRRWYHADHAYRHGIV